MKRDIRKQKIFEKSEGSSSKIVFSKKPIRDAFKEEQQTSESRFDNIVSPQAIQSIFRATQKFQSREKLQVNVIKRSTEIPKIPHDSNFKYSHPYGNGSLQKCSMRMEKGENIIIALVKEENFLIGYGIASSENGKCKIEIIDVDYYSRRETGLSYKVKISGQSFQVGIGHIVVIALLQKCPRPIRVDATHDSSRYIFKSIGFVHDDRSINPCILMMV